MFKKILIIIGVLVILTVIVLGFFFRVSTNEQGAPVVNQIREFKPFDRKPAGQGGGTDTTPTPGQDTPPTDEPIDTEPIAKTLPRLRKLSTTPVIGYTTFIRDREKIIPPDPSAIFVTETPKETEDGTTEGKSALGEKDAPVTETPKPKTVIEKILTVRFVEKTTGNMFDIDIDQEEIRTASETIVALAEEALLGNTGSTILFRYINTDEEIESFLANLIKPTGSATKNSLSGSFLPKNTKTVAMTREGDTLFYMQPYGNGVTATALSLKTKKKVQVFESPFTEWSAQWSNNKTVIISTKPSAYAGGYAYSINTDTKALKKLFGDIPGLTLLVSPNNKQIVYSESVNQTFSTKVFTPETLSTNPFSVKTFPEKCTWSKDSITMYCAVPSSIPKGIYPDDWYQGAVSFSDAIWKINQKTNVATLLVNPQEVVQVSLDIENMKLSDTEDYLIFRNKNDLMLWGSSLN
ncbi:hypothetical protein IT403_00435 [Candidatus Nomurabacteria bacterium]|nr:hypothetical protein [Candidatus Nomurabacteria bacterium]